MNVATKRTHRPPNPLLKVLANERRRKQVAASRRAYREKQREKIRAYDAAVAAGLIPTVERS